MRQPEKVGTVFPLVRHRYHSCDLGKSAMLSAQLYTLCFQALWSSGSKNYNIVRSRVHYTLQNPNTTFQIKFWVFTHGLWRAGSCEHRVVASKLMGRGWKYPLHHPEGGEGTTLKDSKLEAPSLVTALQCYSKHLILPLTRHEQHFCLLSNEWCLQMTSTISVSVIKLFFKNIHKGITV